MHLETIKHLRGLAVAYDDLVPIAKPLLLDLLDSYERHASQPVNEVTAVNPVTSPQPPTPEPSTFEAHGHTWTRHTPGDPCPVPANAMVEVLLRCELNGKQWPECRPAGEYDWTTDDGKWWDIIGWRYATPSTENPA